MRNSYLLCGLAALCLLTACAAPAAPGTTDPAPNASPVSASPTTVEQAGTDAPTPGPTPPASASRTSTPATNAYPPPADTNTPAPYTSPTTEPTAMLTAPVPATAALSDTLLPRYAVLQEPSGRIVRVGADGVVLPWIEQAPVFYPTHSSASSSMANGVFYFTAREDILNRLSYAYQLDADGLRHVDFIPTGVTTLVVWPGDATHGPRLAWEETEFDGAINSRIVIANTDGTDKRILLDQPKAERGLAPFAWSADGTLLYYNNDPTGFGSLYGGMSSLYVYDLKTDMASEYFAPGALGDHICLGTLTPQEDAVTHTCSNDNNVHFAPFANTSGAMVVSPSALELNVVGQPLLNPHGTRLIYSGAQGGPGGEEGNSWILLSDPLDGLEVAAQAVVASAPNEVLYPLAWLDDTTFLVGTYGDAAHFTLASTENNNAQALDLAPGSQFLGWVTDGK